MALQPHDSRLCLLQPQLCDQSVRCLTVSCGFVSLPSLQLCLL